MTIDEEIVRQAFEKIGLVVKDIYELLNLKKKSPEMIRVLTELLDQDFKDDNLKEGAVRALAVKEAKGLAGKSLLRAFNFAKKEEFALRWAIGNSMEVVMTDECVDGVIDVVSDASNGKAREMFVLALGKVRSQKAEEALMKLLNDEGVVAQAIAALSRMESKRSKELITQFINHPRPLVRREAAKALKRLS